MSADALPFDPDRKNLYSPAELFDKFDPANPDSYAKCRDIAIYSYFVANGKNPTHNHEAAALEARHDNAIGTALMTLLDSGANIVAIMGGHSMARGTKPYSDIAHIAYGLAKSGCLVASGGGPGAMEATHLGAAFVRRQRGDLDTAIATLAKSANLPDHLTDLVDEHGNVNPVLARGVHAWLAPAVTIIKELGADLGPSLGVPTWLYGHEPTTPFATYAAKYFQNSLREDGLVTLGVQGIVYAEESAGTVQEIFQDASQNFYNKLFSPMVFLSSSRGDGIPFWEKEQPVRPLIMSLLGDKPDFPDKVLFTESADQALRFLEGSPRVSAQVLRQVRRSVASNRA